MKSILVTGGAGYIGSHTLRELVRRGYSPVCFDNLSTGLRQFVGNLPFVQGDLAHPSEIGRVFQSSRLEAVIHFASHALVEESYRNPYKYYHDNIVNTLNLLEAMGAHNVHNIVFSSSCATYGIPTDVPIRESSPLSPINPYGATKMMIERIFKDYERSQGLRFVSLRYFNAAGADPDGGLGEWHVPETHLIPRLLDVALGRGEAAEVYGNDYPTPDGTCIRDYVHVRDLALAHIAALEYLFAGHPPDVFNIGTGTGHSVMDVVKQVITTTVREVPVALKPRRPGDPPELVADPSKAKAELEWSAQHSSLTEIVETAWSWHSHRAAKIQDRG